MDLIATSRRPRWPTTLALILAMSAAIWSERSAGDARGGARLLDELFQDHAVIQRDQTITLRGETKGGETVTVSLDSANFQAKADTSGKWSVRIPPMPAGGPHVLVAQSSAGAREVASDILFGDIFLCSGQSNIELPVTRAGDANNEIRKSANDTIRMLTVAHADSAVPLEHFRSSVAWQAAAPETVADWSAVCFFFARELQPATGAPIGLIHASWGGSNIRPWMSAAALQAHGSYATGMRILSVYARDPASAQLEFASEWERWWRARSGDHPGSEPWNPARRPDSGWVAAPAGLGDWRSYPDPGLKNFNGMLWYRTRFTLSAAEAGRPATLALGPINQVDQTWLNGKPLGNTFGYETERTYDIPAGALRAGENTLVLNITSTYGPGGLLAAGAQRSLRISGGRSVALQAWDYMKVSTDMGYPHRAPWEPVGGLSTLYNAMIAPLGSLSLRGVLWYQGESNTGEAETYQSLLSGLMSDWRARFGARLPFLVVQLPSYGMQSWEPQESGWAALREAQRRAVERDRRAALAVTIDIGDPHNLHPTNKQDVAKRLARAARHLIYDDPVVPSGPRALNASSRADAVSVELADVEQGLVALSHENPIGFELCGAQPGSCRFADAMIDGSHVLLRVPGGEPPVRVRYCWADSPVCTLFDRSGLPAGPFELSIEPAR
jgi:sialate O-acetylesterase